MCSLAKHVAGTQGPAEDELCNCDSVPLDEFLMMMQAIAKVRAIGKAMRDAKIEVKKKLQDNQI